MNIQTFATWERATSIFGTHDTPLNLLVKATNNTNRSYQINGMCVSIKRMFWFSKDLPVRPTNGTLKPKQSFQIQYSLREMVRDYSVNTQFSIKVFTNQGVFESDTLSVASINDAARFY